VNWRRYLPALLLLEGILIGRMMPRFESALRHRLAPLPSGPPPFDPICPGCWQRSFELDTYGHTHIHAPKPSPLAAPE